MNSKAISRAYINGFLKAAALAGALGAVQPQGLASRVSESMKHVVSAPMPQRPTEDIYTMLKRHEGFRGTNYTDTTGHPTIGYGSTNPNLLRSGSITEPAAASEMTNHLNQVVTQGQQALGASQFNSLPAPAKESVEDLWYQTGSPAKWPGLLNALRDKDYQRAALEIRNSKVNSQTPSRNLDRINMMQSVH